MGKDYGLFEAEDFGDYVMPVLDRSTPLWAVKDVYGRWICQDGVPALFTDVELKELGFPDRGTVELPPKRLRPGRYDPDVELDAVSSNRVKEVEPF